MISPPPAATLTNANFFSLSILKFLQVETNRLTLTVVQHT